MLCSLRITKIIAWMSCASICMRRQLSGQRPHSQAPRTPREVPRGGRTPDLPYVCLRVPTGGGKTILAAYSVGVVTQEFLQRINVSCFGLLPQTPSWTRRSGVQNKAHPYRQALASDFGAT